MSLKAVIFDFDGVIANSEPLHLRAYQEVLTGIGITLTATDYYARYLGYDDCGVFEALGSERGGVPSGKALGELIAEKSRRFQVLLGSSDVIFPGAAECVRRLAAEVPLAIASGAWLTEIEAVLERAGLRDCFAAIVSADDEIPSKPAPDPYLRAVELLGLDPSQKLEPRTTRHAPRTRNQSLSCYVAVEDSRWGLDSARAAGLRCVAVAQTYRPEELDSADLVVPNLSALTLDALRVLCGRDG